MTNWHNASWQSRKNGEAAGGRFLISSCEDRDASSFLRHGTTAGLASDHTIQLQHQCGGWELPGAQGCDCASGHLSRTPRKNVTLNTPGHPTCIVRQSRRKKMFEKGCSSGGNGDAIPFPIQGRNTHAQLSPPLCPPRRRRPARF
jgi:hypothetical protein